MCLTSVFMDIVQSGKESVPVMFAGDNAAGQLIVGSSREGTGSPVPKDYWFKVEDNKWKVGYGKITAEDVGKAPGKGEKPVDKQEKPTKGKDKRSIIDPRD